MRKGRVAIILIETPANPTNSLVDVAMVRRMADEIGKAQGHVPIVACDNTLLGPGVPAADRAWRGYFALFADQVCRRPLRSDRRRGARLQGGDEADQALRCAIGTQLDPHSCWMLGRSLETLALRMEKANRNARLVADYLRDHAKVDRLHYLAHHDEESPAGRLFARQCTAPARRFRSTSWAARQRRSRFLNALQIFKLAVSLGGTESLASLPATMTHSGVPADVRQKMGVLDCTIRLSIGIEHPSDLIADIAQALSAA